MQIVTILLINQAWYLSGTLTVLSLPVQTICVWSFWAQYKHNGIVDLGSISAATMPLV